MFARKHKYPSSLKTAGCVPANTGQKITYADAYYKLSDTEFAVDVTDNGDRSICLVCAPSSGETKKFLSESKNDGGGSMNHGRTQQHRSRMSAEIANRKQNPVGFFHHSPSQSSSARSSPASSIPGSGNRRGKRPAPSTKKNPGGSSSNSSNAVTKRARRSLIAGDKMERKKEELELATLEEKLEHDRLKLKRRRASLLQARSAVNLASSSDEEAAADNKNVVVKME